MRFARVARPRQARASALLRSWTGALMVTLGLWCILTPDPALAAVVCPGPSTLQGVDVSSFDGSVDWNQVASSGAAFATARVSDGLSSDATFGTNYAGIQTAGLIRGAYQFFEPAQDPVAQANLLLASTGPIGPGDLPPILDVEVTGGQSAGTIAAAVQAWVSTVQGSTGRVPIIFTDARFWNQSVGSSAFSTDPLWIAAPSVSCPTLPTSWSSWAFWMYTTTGTVPGITVRVDRDEFNGAEADLLALAGIQPVPAKSGTWGAIKAIYR